MSVSKSQSDDLTVRVSMRDLARLVGGDAEQSPHVTDREEGKALGSFIAHVREAVKILDDYFQLNKTREEFLRATEAVVLKVLWQIW